MKFIDIVRRAGRSLRQAKARTLLTSLAIGVGAFTITLSLAAGEGGRHFVSDVISSNTDPRAVYVQAKQEQQSAGPKEFSDTQKVNVGGLTVIALTREDITAIEKVEHVVSVEPAYALNVQYITRADQKKYEINASVFDPSLKLDYAAGAVSNLKAGEAVLPKEFVDVLGFGVAEGAIGQTVTVAIASPDPMKAALQVPLKIVGVSSGSRLALASQSSLKVSAADARTMYDFATAGTPQAGTFTQATIRVDEERNVTGVKDALNNHYEAMTAKDILGSVYTFINVLQGVLLGFGALAILTSIFGIINTQYISVLERTQQIGLMKALGMRRRDVGRLFKLEAAWIGFLGGAMGAGLAIVMGVIANPSITKALDLGDTHLLIFVPWQVGIVVIGLMIISVVAGILPARKASKLDPIAALRTE